MGFCLETCQANCCAEKRRKKLPLLGFKFSRKSRLKMSVAKQGIVGEEHNSWKGNNASYGSKHDWISRNIGKPKNCSVCKGKNGSLFFEWANISLKYKRNKNDYIQLCRICHRNWDYGSIALSIDGFLYKRKLITKNGSGFTKHKNLWMSQCQIGGKHKYLGLFKNKKLAKNKYLDFRNSFKPEVFYI